MASQNAFAFSLADQDGKVCSLADFAGKKNIVLIFYPGDMTPGCTMHLCAIRDDWAKFCALDTVVFGVNPADAESHKTFHTKYAFPFSLLSDKTKAVATKYRAIRKLGNLKLIKRTVVVINKHGKIVYAKHGVPKNMEILKIITHENS